MIIDRLDQLQHYTPVVNKLDKALIWLKPRISAQLRMGNIQSMVNRSLP